QVALEVGRDRQARAGRGLRPVHHGAGLGVDGAGRTIAHRIAVAVGETAIVGGQTRLVETHACAEVEVVGSLPVQLRFQAVDPRRVHVADDRQAGRYQDVVLEVVP